MSVRSPEDMSGGFLNRRSVVRVHPDAPKFHRIALAEAKKAMRAEVGQHRDALEASRQAASEWKRALARAKREGRRLLMLLDVLYKTA